MIADRMMCHSVDESEARSVYVSQKQIRIGVHLDLSHYKPHLKLDSGINLAGGARECPATVSSLFGCMGEGMIRWEEDQEWNLPIHALEDSPSEEVSSTEGGMAYKESPFPSLIITTISIIQHRHVARALTQLSCIQLFRSLLPDPSDRSNPLYPTCQIQQPRWRRRARRARRGQQVRGRRILREHSAGSP